MLKELKSKKNRINAKLSNVHYVAVQLMCNLMPFRISVNVNFAYW